jgi:sulfur-oxidizing protein SoxX
MRVLGPGTAQFLGGLLAGALALPVLGQPALPTGDAQRGREIVADRQRGFCLLCHSGPFPEEKFQGNLAPPLAQLVQGKTAQSLHERLVDPARFNPDTIMPRYGRPSLGARVHPQFAGQVLLQAGEIDDVVAFLMTLQP